MLLWAISGWYAFARMAGSSTLHREDCGEGVVASIGHTRASASQIADAVSAGATLSTHLGNGTDVMLPKTSNYIWEQLAEDRLAASFIVDGFHLPPPFLNTALRAKGLERSLLVTDAVMPAGCAPGVYKLGEVDVELKEEGSVRLAGGSRWLVPRYVWIKPSGT